MSVMRLWAARATVLAALAVALFPVYWIVLTAFRPREEIFTSPARLLPGTLSLENLRTVWLGTSTNAPVLPFLLTSLVVATASTALTLALAVPAAVALGRHKIGGAFLPMWILSQLFMPAVALLVPLYAIFRPLRLGLNAPGLHLLYAARNL